MKIAMFADSYRPVVDGAVVAMENVCTGLERRGHEVVILAPDTSKKENTGRRVHYLPSAAFRQYPGYRVVIAPSNFMELVRNERVDIIHSHGLASMAILSLTAARALDIPHLLTFHTMAHEGIQHYSPIRIREDIISQMVWIYLRNLLKRPEVVIAPSRPVKDELLANRVRMKACEVVPTGIDTARFSPEKYDKKFLEKYGLGGGKRVLLHVGRLSREKRLDIVLKAIAELAPKEPDLHLMVVGSGPAADHFKETASKLGISSRVVFTGFLKDEDLPVAFASCEALVIASTFETQGLVVLEALASGTPVVGVRYRAIPEFIQEGKNGCLFDQDDCASAIQRCLERSESMMMSAVSSGREYSIDACTARLEKAYDLAVRVRDDNR